jgi:hypothetical protein
MKTIRDEKCRGDLIARLDKLTGEEKPGWGMMSVEQMLSHLVQTGDLPFESSVPDQSNFMSRNVIKPLMLYLLPMPKEIKTSPQMDQQQEGRKPLGFAVDKPKVVGSIERLGTLPLDHDCLGHPFFGKMSTGQWCVLAYKHIDHHLRQFGA